MRPFLQEGLKQYVKAMNTIAAFETQAGLLLKAAVERRQKKRWSPLKGVRFGRPSPGGGSGGDGYWISIAITGKSQRDGEAEIDCGLWWKAPDISEPIIYAEFYYKPKRVMKFSWDGKKKGIRSFEGWGRTFLYLPIPQSLEVEGPLNWLLDALLKQLR